MVCPKYLKNYSRDQIDTDVKAMKTAGMGMSRTSKIHRVPRNMLPDGISGN